MDKKGVAPAGTEVKIMPKCAEGMIFCPMKKKCVPEGEEMSKGKGPMGIPTKETDQLVDDILDGNYAKVKITEQATDMVDVILDMCGKDHSKKKKAVKEETEYQKFFKSTLQKYGVDSPNKLEGEKKKEFFNKIDKGWKGKKEVAEVVNAIDHVPEEDADEETQKLKDEMGKEEKYRQELKRVPAPEMKKKVAAAKAKCAKIKDKKERSQCIFKHMRESIITDQTKRLIENAYNSVIEDKAVMAEADATIELNKELRK
jgi:hypothetical protein